MFKTRNLKAHRSWLSQRLSAVLLGFLYPLLLVWFYKHRNYSQSDLIQTFQNPFVVLFMATSILIAVYHAHLGLTVIIEDYVFAPRSKSRTLKVLKFFCVALVILALVCLFSLIKLGRHL